MSNKKFKQKPKLVKAERVKKEPTLTGRRLLTSLFNNRAAFDGGRYEPGWIAAILFVLSMIIAVIPSMISIGQSKGNEILNGTLYHTDVALTKFVEKLDEKDVDIEVIQDTTDGSYIFSDVGGTGRFATDIATETFTLTGDSATAEIPYYSFSQEITIVTTVDGINTTSVIDYEYIRVYYTADTTTIFRIGESSLDAATYLRNKLTATHSVEDQPLLATSHFIIGQKNLYFNLFNPNKLSDVVPGGFRGKTSSLTLGLNIRDFGLTNLKGEAIDKTSATYTADVIANFALMQENAYKGVKAQEFWTMIGFLVLTNVAISFVMGLIIFISTRGKQNPNRDLKFGESIKVGAWLLLTPALLSLVLGFFIPSDYFQMVFIMALGMRSVWLTMRTLGPQQ